MPLFFRQLCLWCCRLIFPMCFSIQVVVSKGCLSSNIAEAAMLADQMTKTSLIIFPRNGYFYHNHGQLMPHRIFNGYEFALETYPKYLFRRYLNPKDLPKIHSQKGLGALGLIQATIKITCYTGFVVYHLSTCQ